jgi:peroxiredoxin Q/BCP
MRTAALGLVAAAAGVACLLPQVRVSAAGDLAAVGSKAPSFTLPSQENTPVSLADYKGKWVVLYFYPKDQTQGCSMEAHNFQRDLPKYEALNAVVLGVSLDTVESHKTWCTKDSFTFKMLADPEHKAVDAYGVPLMGTPGKQVAKRSTFLISPEGKIVKSWAVNDAEGHSIQGHSAEVLAAIQEMK